MSNFLQRSITGIIFVIVLIGGIYLHPLSCLILFGILTILGIWEFYSLSEKSGAEPQKITGTIGGLVLYLISGLIYYQMISINYFALIIPIVFAPFIIELYKKKINPFTNIGYTLLGLFYIAFPFSLLIYLSSRKEIDWLNAYSPQILLGYFFLLWANDTGAYLFGRKIGKRKLFERISPKKTWEGTIGGGLLSLGIAYVLSINFELLTEGQWIITALIVVIFGNLGDLVESMFKRSINVKDSGTILPGHGGILDRFDGVFISAPIVCAYLMFIA